jgi:hypothetical protein
LLVFFRQRLKSRPSASASPLSVSYC